LDVGINDCDIADETIATNIPLSESKSVENPYHNIKRNFSPPALQLNKLFADIDINKNDGAVQSARSRLDGHTYNVSDNEWEQIPRDGKASEPMKTLSTDIIVRERKEKN
jgi:serine/threonine-protein phosphatase 2B regulatory subunit